MERQRTPYPHRHRPRAPRASLRALLSAAVAAALLIVVLFTGARADSAPTSPIDHVVIVYQENHTFDNVLGRWCKRTGRCDGAVRGRLASGRSLRLRRAPDVVPGVGHSTASQSKAIHGGQMDGFSRIKRCTADFGHRCYSQYLRRDVPNLIRLARTYTLSDRTFQTSYVPSFGAHIELVAGDLAGFLGDSPKTSVSGGKAGPGWGCDSKLDALWRARPGGKLALMPACIPDPSLDPHTYPFGGAYRPTRVPHRDTIMDRLDEAGLPWRLYTAARAGGGGYMWAICPTFAGCLYTDQRRNQVARAELFTDAQQGNLPSFSVVLPPTMDSQHNQASMKVGDDWIGEVVSAIQTGPDWPSTAIFITYDDCGCFYDHVAPPPGLGLRVPMVIVSPYAKPAFTDHVTASLASLLAFTEHNFGLEPLGGRDESEDYWYQDAFDYGQDPVLSPTPMVHQGISKAKADRIRERLLRMDAEDTT